MTVGAIIGSTLMALSLAGSYRNPANWLKSPDQTSLAEIARLHALGKTAFSEGRYGEAREAFGAAAREAMSAGSSREAAMNWSNAGFAAVSAMQYRPALEDLSRARATAEASGEMTPLIYALNNLASLYLQMGAWEDALRISRDALAGPASHADAGMHAKLLYQEAQALASLNRLAEAEPVFGEALAQLAKLGDFDAAARGWSALGAYYVDAERYGDAETALNESLRLARNHGVKATAYALTNLARVRGKQGDRPGAERLFQAAFDAHESVTPLWVIYYERGRVRLAAGDLSAALGDFREARRLAIRLRADMVPADQDRVALENRVSRIFEGLVEAGNRLALSTGEESVLEETFDAAEQDRLWSLRSLVPDASDWRARLPAGYWELLPRFQAAERELLADQAGAQGDRSALEKRAADLELALQQQEAAAGADTGPAADDAPAGHVRAILDADSVLFSFSVSKTGSWLWAVEKRGISVYALPPADEIAREVADFNSALRDGNDATAQGLALYRSLFGGVPAAILRHRRWLLEPDGPLHELPFAALPAEAGPAAGRKPEFLIERAALQSVPGALLLEKGALRAGGVFVGVGDPVFNAADSRYRAGAGREGRKAEIVLPRLPNTAAEVDACSGAWGSDARVLLTGAGAGLENVEEALNQSPAVIHFATHVVTAPDEYGSGLIALGLDGRGAMGLLGPKDIAARRIPGSLVVMNGCHSAQGKALPGSGLMGLTRAWIGAGARAVVSTRWDVPDDAAQSLMVSFYRALRHEARGNPALALQAAQVAALRAGGIDGQPARWAGYFLLSRIR